MIGAIALGWPHESDAANVGASANRTRRSADQIMHINGW
jgi:hypothetical protein